MADKKKNTFVRHATCPKCGSEKGLAIYSDGSATCFSIECKAYFPNYEEGVQAPSVPAMEPILKKKAGFVPIEIKALKYRGISEDVCKVYQYGYADHKGKRVQVSQYFNSGIVVAQHLRFEDKTFKWLGDSTSLELFGQHLFRFGGKRIFITEGQIDAMTVYQVMNKRWPAVSIPSGIDSAKKYILQNIEYLNSYEEVILVFDMDGPGQKGVETCIPLFTPGKVKVVSLPLKDPNAMLQEGRTAELISALWEAKVYRPDGIVLATDIPLSKLQDSKVVQSYETPFPELNTMLRGLRKELTIVTAGSGIGKTTLLKEVGFGLHKQGLRVGHIALEESTDKTLLSYMAIHENVPMGNLYLDRTLFSPTQWKVAYKEVAETGRLHLYNHFGSMDTDNLISKLRFLALGCGVDFILLDHISIVISGLSEGEERRLIDNLMTNLRSLVENTGVGLLAVSHLKNPEKGTPHEEGGRVYANQLRGSGAIKQLSDNIIALERNQQADDPNEAYLRLLKNRLFGTTGLCDTVHYNPLTGRLVVGNEGAF